MPRESFPRKRENCRRFAASCAPKRFGGGAGEAQSGGRTGIGRKEGN
jgi:hypothetical protein